MNRSLSLQTSVFDFFNLSSATHISQTVLLGTGDVPDDQSTVQKGSASSLSNHLSFHIFVHVS